MHIINLHFQRFSETAFSDLFRSIGVYVIWDGRQKVRPSYIGEGNVLERFATEHAKRFARPLDGYVAILGDISDRSHKVNGRISETLLLEVADRTDRYPTVNRARGHYKPVDEVFQDHGVLKVTVAGYDPLSAPWSARRLAHKKTILLRKQGQRIEITYDWKMRYR